MWQALPKKCGPWQSRRGWQKPNANARAAFQQQAHAGESNAEGTIFICVDILITRAKSSTGL